MPDHAGLSLDRIRRMSAEGEEGGLEQPEPAGRAPVVAGTPLSGAPGNLLTSFDGLGAFDNGDGTFTVLMNHELQPALGIVREHGGWIEVASEVGKGSCFSVYLPREADHAR